MSLFNGNESKENLSTAAKLEEMEFNLHPAKLSERLKLHPLQLAAVPAFSS